MLTLSWPHRGGIASETGTEVLLRGARAEDPQLQVGVDGRTEHPTGEARDHEKGPRISREEDGRVLVDLTDFIRKW